MGIPEEIRKSIVTLIVGLPGSGKSYLANTMVQEDPTLFLIDDMIEEGDLQKAKTFIQNGQSGIITDPQLCLDQVRSAAEKAIQSWGGSVQFIFFENNPKACLHNTLKRNDKRKVDGFIKWVTTQYNPPANSRKVEFY